MCLWAVKRKKSLAFLYEQGTPCQNKTESFGNIFLFGIKFLVWNVCVPVQWKTKDAQPFYFIQHLTINLPFAGHNYWQRAINVPMILTVGDFIWPNTRLQLLNVVGAINEIKYSTTKTYGFI